MVLTIMQMIRPISITNGVPTISLSLIFVISLSMIKDLIEDYKRYKSDRDENYQEVYVFEKGIFKKCKW